MGESVERLPVTFSYQQARDRGVSKRQLYRWRDDGVVELLGRGLYHRVDGPIADVDLIEIAHRAPHATLCLTSALVQHGLSDAIPAAHDIAIPRGDRPPLVSVPVRWHRFMPETFGAGREELPLDDETAIGVYSRTRTIVDVFRLAAQVGTEVGYEALRRWLASGGKPGDLLAMATYFPRTLPRLRATLEVLL